MATSTQEHTKDTSRLRRAFLPTKIEAVALLMGSFFFLLIINAISVFRSVSGKNYTQVRELIESYVDKLLAPTNNELGSQIFTVFFWMFVGIGAYLLVTAIIGLVGTYNSDVHWSKRLILPQGSSGKKVTNEFMLRLAVRIFSTFLLLYWLYLFLTGVLPYASLTFLESITDFSLINALWVAWAVIVMASSIFVVMICARCIVLRERVFGG